MEQDCRAISEKSRKGFCRAESIWMEVSIGKMKHYFKQAKFLLIIYTLIAMLLNLGSMAYIKHKNDFKAFPQLSQHYAVGSITSGEHLPDLRKRLLKAAAQNSGRYLLATEFTGIHAFAVYYTDQECFPLELKAGRLFQQEDFENSTDTVLINVSAQKNCRKKGGSLFWKYGNREFRVIGVYSNTDCFGDQTPDCFFNFCAKSLDPSVFDTFIYDASLQTLSDLKKIKVFAEKSSEDIVLDYAAIGSEQAEEFSVSSMNFTPMFMMMVLTMLLILFNSIAAVQNWLSARRREIAVRKLVGASGAEICLWIGKSLSVLIFFAWGIGTVLSWMLLKIGLVLPTRESVQLMFGLHLQWSSLLCGLAAALLLCGMMAAFAIWQEQRQEIARRLV